MSIDNQTLIAPRVDFAPPSPPDVTSDWDTTDPEAPWFSYADIDEFLDPNIEVLDQIVVERFFDLTNKTGSRTVKDRREMFILPKAALSVDTVNKRITLDLTEGSLTYLAESGEVVEIPTFTAGADTVTIRRQTASSEMLSSFQPGRLSPNALNRAVLQLLRINQEILSNLKYEYLRKDDQYAAEGPFLGEQELNMGGFSILNLAYPAAITDAASKYYVCDKVREFGVFAKDDTPPDSGDVGMFNESDPDYSPAALWFDPKTGKLALEFNGSRVILSGLQIPVGPAGGPGGNVLPMTGAFHLPQGWVSIASPLSSAPAANHMTLAPYSIGKSGLRIVAARTAQASLVSHSGNMRFVVYQAGEDGLPGAKLYESGNIALVNTNNFVYDVTSLDIDVTQGYIWAGWLFSAAPSVKLYTLNARGPTPMSDPVAGTYIDGLDYNIGAFSAPSTLVGQTPTNLSGTTVPFVALKFDVQD